MTVPVDGSNTACRTLIENELSWVSNDYYEGMCTCLSGDGQGNQLCEGLGYDEDRCVAQGCCQWNDQQQDCSSNTADEWEPCNAWDNRDRLSYADDQYALDQAPGATCLGLCGQEDPCNDGNGNMCCWDGTGVYGDFWSYRNLDWHMGDSACNCPTQTCTDAAAYDTANPPHNYCKSNAPHICRQSRQVDPEEMMLEQAMVDTTCLAQCKNDPICFTPGQGLSWAADMGGDGEGLDDNDCTAYLLRTGMTYQEKCENSTKLLADGSKACYWDSFK